MVRTAVWLRVGLILYLAVTALVGMWAALWPRGFYDDFPWPGHPWVALLGTYNEHLVRDFGAMNLAVAVVLGVAAVTLDRRPATTALFPFREASAIIPARWAAACRAQSSSAASRSCASSTRPGYGPQPANRPSSWWGARPASARHA